MDVAGEPAVEYKKIRFGWYFLGLMTHCLSEILTG
jgi:hypothetical protein